MKPAHILPAWGRILRGYRPLLALEITKECPLRCPGCYAYDPQHLGGGMAFRDLSDYRDERLIQGVLALVRRIRPIHISIVGGEPLVRYRELDVLLPQLDHMGIEVQLVTSAVRPIPAEWASFECLHLAVSVDGLPEEHDRRRKPATYQRISKHIAGHQVIVHCTVTQQMAARPGYFREFAALWSARPEVRKIWFSLYTPQAGDRSEERLTPAGRAAVIAGLVPLPALFPKVYLPRRVVEGFLRPPHSPEECVFARTTACISADLETVITPCQFGGQPVCEECGCMASAGLAALGRYKLAGLVRVGDILSLSERIGGRFGPAPETRPVPNASAA